ncbi:FkbM family methyltransferase [Methyloferula stellata]|uniref:FkbM family methyltransferase n=1 Tax=Methyloferula stellata TaxID=876270 RepID=UPI0003A72E5F|nr:FkbM family methyltransferase [Methyloferula stellata]
MFSFPQLFKIRLWQTKSSDRPKREGLMWSSYLPKPPQPISENDKFHQELGTALNRCRSFPYDLDVFARIEPEIKYLKHLTSQEKVGLDLGANLGFYSALLAPLCSRVIAFEANPQLIPYLMINTHRYGNVTVVPLAVARQAGEAVFNIPFIEGEDPIGYMGMGGITSGDFLTKLGVLGAPIRVQTIPIDALALTDVGFMKIDVEGSEHEVLEGARTTIERWRPAIIVENEFRHNPECTKVFEFLLSRGYEGYFVDRVTLELTPFEKFSLEANQKALLDEKSDITDNDRYIYNFIFVPREANNLREICKA